MAQARTLGQVVTRRWPRAGVVWPRLQSAMFLSTQGRGNVQARGYVVDAFISRHSSLSVCVKRLFIGMMVLRVQFAR